MASRSRRITLPGSALIGSTGHNEPEEPASDAGAQIPSDAGGVAPASTPVLKYTEEDLQKWFIQAQVHEQAQVHWPDQATGELYIEPRFPDLYFGKSHMECFEFCLQCENHFDIAGITGFNRSTVAASFLRGRINYRWHQHKRRTLVDRPLSWLDFKAFLRKHLRNSWPFVDSIWSRLKRDSQYQKETVSDWAFHLEYLRDILVEFDPEGAPQESDLIHFFMEGIKPSVKLYMNQCRREPDSWEEILVKAKGGEAKAGLLTPFMLREMDHRCPQGDRPENTSVPKTRASLLWDPRHDSFNAQATSTRGPRERDQTEDRPTHSSRSENPTTSNKKSRREKKKQYCFDLERARKDSAPAPSVNTTNTSSEACEGGVRRGGGRNYLSHITCFKCNETGHYANKCPERAQERTVTPRN